MLELYVSTDAGEVEELLFRMGFDRPNNPNIKYRNISLEEVQKISEKIWNDLNYTPMSKITLTDKIEWQLEDICKKFTSEGLFVSYINNGGELTTVYPEDLAERNELLKTIYHHANTFRGQFHNPDRREFYPEVQEYINKSPSQIKEMLNLN